MHLFFFSMVVATIFLGGWENLIFVANFFIDYVCI
jgi:NADH:ubiquinone oxidoreductase subunit H